MRWILTFLLIYVSNIGKAQTSDGGLSEPFYTAGWAIALCVLLLIIIVAFALRLLYLKKEKKNLEDKFRFFINTAHDMRTPLTLVKAPLEEIKNREQLSKEGIINMSTALKNLNVLLKMSNNLIDVEKIESDVTKLNLAEYELNAYIEEIMKPFKAYALSRRINFTYDSNFRFLSTWIDKEKMDSVLVNIISNALKYTPDNGSVSIYASEKNNSWNIEIKDTGIGIPAEEQKKLFKESFRGQNAINSHVGGSGIGMMLVGRLIKLHKGEVNLSSVEQKGTTITVTFPLDKKSYKKAQIVNAIQTETIVNHALLPVRRNTESETEKGETKTPQGNRLLLVEDNKELREYLVQTLSEEYTVQTCSNGKDALVIVEEYKPELIISDVVMPEMDGNELCATIKGNIDTSHIPIILITALNDEEDILKGIQTGADEYIVKPFNIGILKASIANLLANRKLLRDKYASLDMREDEDDPYVCINCNTNIDWEFMSALKKNVENNMASPTFNVDSLSILMNMSRTSLYNKVKALTDASPGDYIRIIKLKKAAEYLKDGRYNVSEVAELTGFNDAKYFREVFKRHFDISPSKYKG